MEYMVSYQLLGGVCGNRCGTLAEVKAYAKENAAYWRSHGFYKFNPDEPGVAKTLRPLDPGELGTEI